MIGYHLKKGAWFEIGRGGKISDVNRHESWGIENLIIFMDLIECELPKTCTSETYYGPCHTPRVEFFAKIVNGFLAFNYF